MFLSLARLMGRDAFSDMLALYSAKCRGRSNGLPLTLSGGSTSGNTSVSSAAGAVGAAPPSGTEAGRHAAAARPEAGDFATAKSVIRWGPHFSYRYTRLRKWELGIPLHSGVPPLFSVPVTRDLRFSYQLRNRWSRPSPLAQAAAPGPSGCAPSDAAGKRGAAGAGPDRRQYITLSCGRYLVAAKQRGALSGCF